MATPAPTEQPDDAIALLEMDHRTVEALHEQFGRARGHEDRTRLATEIIKQLSMHSAVEEMIFYPAVRETVGPHELVDDALAEHQDVKEGLRELEKMDVSDPAFSDRLDQVLSEVADHVEEEETQMFPRVRQVMDEQRLREIGQAMQRAKMVAPTHPHPGAPNEPPANVVVGSMTGIVDRVMDTVSGLLGRRGGAASPASPLPGIEV